MAAMLHIAGFLCLIPALYAVELVAVQDAQGRYVWNDRSSGADRSVVIYEPFTVEPTHLVLGMRAQPNHNALAYPLLYFRQVDEEGDALATPDDFVFIWDDRNTGSSDSVSFWRVFCPVGYVSLGDAAYPVNRISSPDNLYSYVRCVRVDLTEECSLGESIWDDRGSGGDFDTSVWSVNAADDTTSGYFYTNSNHGTPPGLTPRCLRDDAYIIV